MTHAGSGCRAQLKLTGRFFLFAHRTPNRSSTWIAQRKNMAEKSCCVELFNFDRVLWDKRSRRKICQGTRRFIYCFSVIFAVPSFSELKQQEQQCTRAAFSSLAVSFKQWTLAWCGQQSLILVNTKDVEASAHVSL